MKTTKRLPTNSFVVLVSTVFFMCCNNAFADSDIIKRLNFLQAQIKALDYMETRAREVGKKIAFGNDSSEVDSLLKLGVLLSNYSEKELSFIEYNDEYESLQVQFKKDANRIFPIFVSKPRAPVLSVEPR